jgi:putative DNA methylase
VDDPPRLIEVAFPLKQASLDSVHEKNVRHGHISTLHIWPARRPLAACRAALIATLLPDPGTPEKRKELLEKIGGKVISEVQKKKVGGKTVETIKERTEGGILRWGNENNPDMGWFREEIKKAYGGRAPRVLDPFAGGGAIPLEAMRLGCEVTAVDINPVAWFLLKCTLEYPQKLAGQTRPLPKFALESGEFMEAFLKGTGKLSKKQAESEVAKYQRGLFPPPEAELAWHVRAWGWWVLRNTRNDLDRYYPTIDAKPTVAYLWARTVTCKNCRATIPLLKTRWLCKTDTKRVVLTMEPNAEKTGVVFGVKKDVPIGDGNAAHRRGYDKKVGAGSMSRSGMTCPCCGIPSMTMEDIRLEGRSSRLGSVMTSVVVDGVNGKEYRSPRPDEIHSAAQAGAELESVFAYIPFGIPNEPTPAGGGRGAGRAFSVQGFGIMRWSDMFTPRQLLSIGTFVKWTRAARVAMESNGYPREWSEAVNGFLSLSIDRIVDYNSTQCVPDPTPTQSGIRHTFSRFAFGITWDFIEGAVAANYAGSYSGALEWVAKYVEHGSLLPKSASPHVICGSAITQRIQHGFDLVITDPPYYDAIPYSDLMDFFYVWLRRCLADVSDQITENFGSYGRSARRMESTPRRGRNRSAQGNALGRRGI